ncbi:acyl-CoA-binding protein-like [Haliotis rubra]|uniref:acyl-CoA-binding protein-like n=1 Tax=Haliotis rubra TaxID=36100 RepID=UPI001EE50853|nr:acyl-CoA-binding protein-like [Haliotis rubra]
MADEATFYMAAEEVNNLKSEPSDEELMEMYALYKQATAGDCNTAKPGASDVIANAKWGAWNDKKGLSKDKARAEYVAVVEELKEKYGI